LGIDVILPKTAAKMKREGRENDEVKTDWSTASIGYHGKAYYLSPNVLMEMAIAFHLKKPIYILNGQPEDSPLIDEILGLEPIFLNGDLGLIKF
jgi:hypothetical protein